ncbi:hypothetical protein D3OALGA1CA_5218 [Olavius algarvensis associated proteobacterium Delta 3]|nr:hypothetical protein D3OALGB2SA_581 [Olavius algarvensis associated proteobacterium Delta 3]CAB5163593.1 hypothetical protein D3OALGA1CA_5218 [Olavius algarvensis associated proteobacterium Delta 3]
MGTVLDFGFIRTLFCVAVDYRFQVSDFGFQGELRFQVSGVGCQVSGVR